MVAQAWWTEVHVIHFKLENVFLQVGAVMKYCRTLRGGFSFVLLFTLSLLCSSLARAQAGQLDLAFDAGPIVHGTAGSSQVSAIALQPDGKILVGGFFTSVNGTSRNQLFRLNADGSLDLSFNTPLLFNASVGDGR